MNNLVKIGNSDLSIKEFNGQRVVTFKDVDSVHERPDGTARKRFNDNRYFANCMNLSMQTILIVQKM